MRDDEYQRTARALAREMKMPEASAARIEDAILRAVDRREGGAPERGWKWLAVAATITLIAASIALWNVSRVPVNTTTAERTAPERSTTVADIVLPLPSKATVPSSQKPAPATRLVHRAQIARVVSPSGFVELPWSGGLPAFESGEIVRVEVPVASLPAYGFDISRGTSRSVEADVLVGQDGLARAMRLVNNSTRSTQ